MYWSYLTTAFEHHPLSPIAITEKALPMFRVKVADF